MKKNEGSAILWAIAIIMILAILVAAGLTMSYTHYNRSVLNNNKNQAYISAKGIIENIVSNIAVEKDDQIANQYYLNMIPSEPGKTTELDIQDFPGELGEVKSVKIVRKLEGKDEDVKDVITITVTLLYVEEEETVNADLMNVSKEENKEIWQLIRYYRGTPDNNINVVNGSELIQKMTETLNNRDDIKDIYGSISDENYNKLIEDGYKFNKDYFKPDNDNLRLFYFYEIYGGKWPEFDNNATNIPDILGNKKYYIQPYFTHNKYEQCIVFASTYESKINGIWGESVRLFYSDGHWYYVKKGRGMTSFNDSPDKSAVEKWKEFKEEYLIPENQIT